MTEKKKQSLESLVEKAWANAMANGYQAFLRGHPLDVAVDMMDSDSSLEDFVAEYNVNLPDVANLVEELQKKTTLTLADALEDKALQQKV